MTAEGITTAGESALSHAAALESVGQLRDEIGLRRVYRIRSASLDRCGRNLRRKVLKLTIVLEVPKMESGQVVLVQLAVAVTL